jgi:hypothetical protein
VKVDIWSRFETTIDGDEVHDNQLRDVRVEVTFTSPSGRVDVGEAFWDGAKNWGIRYSPDEVGIWAYHTACEQDAGLDGREGQFPCVAYKGDNPLYRHGDIRVSDDGHHLNHADGTPFFWLADTAWNGALLSDEQGWAIYLDDRRRKGFSAVQFVATQWRSAGEDADGYAAFSGVENIRISPEFFQRLDRRFNTLNGMGLLAAPVLLWALGDSPGAYLPEDQAALLARYMVARYGAHQTLWILGGDGDYPARGADRWRRIGREVFGKSPRHLVTMHPQGRHWIAEEFRDEEWFGVNCYQSGHGDGEEHLRWHVDGPPSTEWERPQPVPHLNFEPHYEGHLGYTSREPYDAHAVRRACYWSLLIGPPAGVSYGAHGVWGWHTEARLPVDHPNTGVGPAWWEAARFDGSTSMLHLREFFDAIPWWRLRPHERLVAIQPGVADIRQQVVAATTDDGCLAVVYTPVGAELTLDLRDVALPAYVTWYDPARGVHTDVGRISHPGVHEFLTPGDGDHLLVIAKEPE